MTPLSAFILLLAADFTNEAAVPTDTGRHAPREDHVFFRQRGKTVSTKGYIHISVEMNFTSIMSNIKVVDDFIHKLQGADKHHGQAVLERHRDELAKLKAQLQSYLDLPQPLTKREKRQLDLLFGIGNTLFGLYNQYEITELQGQVAAEETAITDIIHKLDDQDATLHDYGLRITRLEQTSQITAIELTDFEWYVDGVETVASFVETLRWQVEMAGTVTNALMDQKLAVQAVTQGAMMKMLKEADKSAEERGYELLPNNAAEAHQCPCSFIIKGGIITAFLHLPLAKTGDIMVVYEYLSVPLAVDQGLQITVHPEHAVIATNQARTEFMTMTTTALTACDKRGAFFVCPDANGKHRAGKVAQFDGEKDQSLCPWFLLTQDQDAVRKACTVEVHKRQSQFFELSGTEFVFLEKDPHQGALACRGQETRWIQVGAATRITVPPGCTFTTDTAIATGVLNLALNSTPITFAWDDTPETLLAGLDLPWYKELLDSVQPEKTRVPREVTDIHDWMASKARWNSHSNLTTSSVVTWVIIIAVILAAVLLAGCCWWRRRKTRLAEQAAPRIPLAVFASQQAKVDHYEDNRASQFRLALM